MDSEPLVVGEEDCTIKDIVDVFFNDANSGTVFDKWKNVARELQIKSFKIERWRLAILHEKETEEDVLHNIFESWKTQKGKDATLPNLIKHLETINLHNIAHDLRKIFSTETRLHKAGGQVFKPTLPKTPKYYIPRTLITRRVIDAKVFSSTHKDVFVIHEINRYRLSRLAKKELTDTSTHQVRNQPLSVRFILLESFGDWALLCGMTTNPIHLLRYHEGRFHWIGTKGDISALQQASDEKDQNELTEKEFIDEIETDVQFQINQTICISDSPGMGKSLLLENIGRQLQQRYPQRCIAFIAISEFVVKIRELLPKFSSRKLALVEALLELCENSARKQLVQKMTTPKDSPSTQIELMFDGFDEVSTENFKLAHECLEILKTNFNSSTRIWVTTRPQHFHELEKRLSVLGHNIEAFQDKHQIDFLTSYWNSHGSELDEDRLQSFSESCLSTIKSKLNKKDEDVAGIPLQCMMIAEIYMQDAHRFSDSKNKKFKHCPEAATSIDIKSIADLYEKMIANKIGKFINTYPLIPENINRILPWHMYLALDLIFPSHAHRFKDILQIDLGLQPDYLVNIGILERRGSTAKDPSRFIHRTFAEYLTARFFVSHLISHSTAGLQNTSTYLPNFLLKHVLECSVTKCRDYRPSKHFQCSFTHSVLCYFFNALLGAQTEISTKNSINQSSTSCIKNVIYACIHSEFGNIIKFLYSLKYPRGFFIKNILYSSAEIFTDATRWSSLHLLKFLLQSFEHEPLTTIKTEIPHLRTALHAAVRRGNYTIFEYILKEHHFEHLVKKDKQFKDLVHHAVEDTVDDNVREVQDRVQILTALCVDYSLTPLLANRVHVKLLKILIKCGANLFHLDSPKNTILHQATEYLSPIEYYHLLQFIPKTALRSLLQMRNVDDKTSLRLVVKHGLAIRNVLHLILLNGGDVNASDGDGFTCMFDASEIENEDMILPTVKLLLENGADHTRVNCFGDSILHHAAKKGRNDILRVLLEEKNMNVNQINNRRDTPIFNALFNRDSALETVEFLLERGADYTILNKNRSNLLHYAAANGQLECLKLFLSLGGLDINDADDDGDTPLLCTLYRYHQNSVEMIRLLLDKGADHTMSDKLGNNVLHRLAYIGNADCTSEFNGLPLLDVNARNCDNDTPLHLVFRNLDKYNLHYDYFNSMLQNIEALVSFGADLNAKNDDSKTPFDLYQVMTRKLGLIRHKEELLKKDLTIRKLLDGPARKSPPE